jgi:predicted permease
MFNLKLAFRALFRSPFVSLVAILSLGLGIGANGAIFSLFNQFLLQPLPVTDPGRLVNLSAPGPMSGSTSCNQAGNCDVIFSYPMFRDLEARQSSFTGIAAHRLFGANLAYNGSTERSTGLLVSGSYFSVLGLAPASGRLIGAGDDPAPGQSAVAVLNYRYWRTRFESNPDVLGQTLTVNGQPTTIVGIAPEGFEGTTVGSRPDVFIPITLTELVQPGRTVFDNRRSYWIYLFARLKPGVSMEQAAAAINVPFKNILEQVEAPLQAGMSEPTLERFKAKTVLLETGTRGQSTFSREASGPLIVLLLVTLVVLLSACANIANLLLAKATGRASEMAVRLSIGAARSQLVSQLLGESLLLAALGGLLGLAIAQWTLTGIMLLLPPEVSRIVTFTLDGRMLAFLAGITVATGLLFGLFPALNSTRPNLAVALKGQAGQPGGARSAKRFRTALATSQVVLSMALLAIAGLFLKSLVNISRVDLGVRTENVVAFGISPQMNGYPNERSRQIFEQVEDELARLPGVTGLTAGMVPLLGNSNWGTNVTVEGFPVEPDTDTHSNYNEIAPDYFKTLAVPLLAGREFTLADTLNAPRVAIINEAFAKKFGLGRDAVGRRMESGNSGRLGIEIVGLVKDAKYSEVKEAVPPLFFTPYRQDERVGSLTFYATTAGPTDSVVAAIKPMMERIDPTLPVVGLRTMEEQVRQNVFEDRVLSTLAAVFAGLATILAAVGLYGVMAYTVAQRTREIGLRMALGADRSRIQRLVLGQVARVTVIGGLIGLGLAVAAGVAAQSQLYEMQGYDPTVLALAAAGLAVVAFAAGFLPAYRASRVDPMLALRYE